MELSQTQDSRATFSNRIPGQRRGWYFLEIWNLPGVLKKRLEVPLCASSDMRYALS